MASPGTVHLTELITLTSRLGGSALPEEPSAQENGLFSACFAPPPHFVFPFKPLFHPLNTLNSHAEAFLIKRLETVPISPPSATLGQDGGGA